MRRLLIVVSSLLASITAIAQTVVSQPSFVPSRQWVDLGNGPLNIQPVDGSGNLYSSFGSGIGSTSGSSTALTLTTTPSVAPCAGCAVSGPGIAPGTTIAAFNGVTAITLSTPMNVPASSSVTWGAACPAATAAGIPSVSLSPAVPVRAGTNATYPFYTQARLCAYGAAQSGFAFLYFALVNAPTVVLPSPSPPPPPSMQVIPAANDVTANWQNAGLAVIGGIPTRSTQCGATVTTSGMIPPMTGDDHDKIVAAIAACPTGQVVGLASGTFNVAQSQLPIVVNKGITIRGNGSTVGACDASMGTPCWPTVLQTYDGPQPKYNPTPQCGVTIGSTTPCPNGSGFFFVAPGNLFTFGWAACAAAPTSYNPTTNMPPCGTLVAADAAKGDLTVQVADTSNFSVGTWALIDESAQYVSTANPTGGANIQASPEFLSTSDSPVVMRAANPDAGNCTYTFCTNRVNEEIHLISAIGAGPCPGVACTVTFDSPLTMAYRQSGSHDARMYWPTQQTLNVANPFLQQAGIENLTLNRVNGGGVNFEFCAYCWVKNVEVNYWIGGGANTVHSARIEITGNYLHNCIDCQNNGEEYPIGISTGSTEVLVANNISVFGGKGMVGRAANSAVIAHNYFDKEFYETGAGIGDYWNDMSANGSHYAGTHHFLFEGNWGNNCDGDETHGNAIYHTFFRNQCSAARSTFVDPSNGLTVNDCAGIGFADPANTPTAPAPLRAAGPMAFNYWYAFAGNVLGFSGMQSCAGGVFTYLTYTNRSMWISGWTGAEWPAPDANLDGVSHSFIFKNGNYDFVNSGVVDYAVGYPHTFPNSLYRSTTPAYFGPGASCTYTYPWIDSTSGTPVKSNSCSGSGLPAKARYEAGTPFVQP